MPPIDQSSEYPVNRLRATGLEATTSVGSPAWLPKRKARSARHAMRAGLAALSLAATALAVVALPLAVSAAVPGPPVRGAVARGAVASVGMAAASEAMPTEAVHRVLYAYAGGRKWSAGCPEARNPAMGCSLADALAQAMGGDTVALATAGRDGHYVGNWRVLTPFTSASEPLRVVAGPGVAGPVLDGNAGQAKGCQTKACDGPVLFVGARVHLYLHGLTIENARDRANPHGGGMRNDLAGVVAVSNCTFYDDRASWGGAIDNADANGTGTLSVTGSTFRDDEASHGGAISNHGRVSVSLSAFLGNRATNGGAIDNGDGGSLVVASSSFVSDSAQSDGGAIDNADHGGRGSAKVSGSTFRSNRARNGGAIANADNSGDGTLSVQGSNFLANNSSTDGGAVDNADPGGQGTVSVSASVFSGGAAGKGGGAVANGTGSVSVSTSTLSGNQAGYGGALENDYDYVPPGPLVYARTQLAAPSATEAGHQAGGHAKAAGHGAPRLSVSASMFVGNGADCGGWDVSNGPGLSVTTIRASTFDLGGPPTSAAGSQGQAAQAGPLLPAGVYVPTCDGGASVLNQGSLLLWSSTFVDYDIADASITDFVVNEGVGWAVANLFSVGSCALGGAWHDMGYNVWVEPDSTGGTAQVPCIGAAPVPNGGHTSYGNRDADVPSWQQPGWVATTFLGPAAHNGGPTETVLPLRNNPGLGLTPYGTTLKMDNRVVSLCPTTDQRGVMSTPGAACAAGAVQPPYGPPAPRVEVSTWSTSYLGSVLVWGGKAARAAHDAGSALYEFSGDTDGKFGCTTRPVLGYSPFASSSRASCTGPESDFVNFVTGDEWAALTTTGKPIAGPGVDQALLGTVRRPGVGNQVTYAGHPLYLLDHPTPPGALYGPSLEAEGEGYLESVAPLYPRHGIWWLVSAKDGEPAADSATVMAETLPDGKLVLAFQPDGLAEMPVTVYSYSLDRRSASTCTGACALTWFPLLTRGKPGLDPNLANKQIVVKDLGYIRRPDGLEQATYQGKPLYLYSGERYIFPGGPGPGILPSGTEGNGNGMRGPKGGAFSVVYLGH